MNRIKSKSGPVDAVPRDLDTETSRPASGGRLRRAVRRSRASALDGARLTLARARDREGRARADLAAAQARIGHGRPASVPAMPGGGHAIDAACALVQAMRTRLYVAECERQVAERHLAALRAIPANGERNNNDGQER